MTTDGRYGDHGGPYATSQEAFYRQQQLTQIGIWTGVIKLYGMWTLVHNPRGSISDLKAEGRIT